ncbi:hypothetical protein [Streptomyces erythrochromogenes]|uniref:hypothetical protein n=1 Tax=Streptomyces erythrochromogenes TaxID=285574 RepID=UPI0036CC03C6
MDSGFAGDADLEVAGVVEGVVVAAVEEPPVRGVFTVAGADCLEAGLGGVTGQEALDHGEVAAAAQGELFARTSRTVRLTEVGRQFRDDLQPV